jgi:endonuclease V-like protein UPF0215 family
MKRHIRAMGVDDAPFRRGLDGRTLLVGVVVRAPSFLEAVEIRPITVDGNDSTSALVDMLSTPHGRIVSAVITQACTFAGFNVFDPVEVHRRTGKPVISVRTRSKRDVVAAIRKAAENWERRLEMMSSGVEFEWRNRIVRVHGMEVEEAIRVLDAFTQEGSTPEPVRLADLIAGAIGEARRKGL